MWDVAMLPILALPAPNCLITGCLSWYRRDFFSTFLTLHLLSTRVFVPSCLSCSLLHHVPSTSYTQPVTPFFWIPFHLCSCNTFLPVLSFFDLI